MALSIPIISEFDGKGISRAIEEFKNLEGAGAKAQFAIKKAAVPATAALVGIGAALGDCVKAAAEDAAAQAQLATALKNNTHATDQQVSATENWITTQGKLLGVADDKLRPALSILARQTHSVGTAMDATRLAMDISAATGKDLESVSTILAKAYGGNIAALAKLSPELKGAIKDGMTLDDAMKSLSETFGGSAAKAADTAQGRMERFKLALSETKESIGAALLPALTGMFAALQPIGDWAQEHTTVFLVIAGVIGGFAAAIVAVNVAMKVWQATTAAFTAVQAVFNAVLAMNPITLIVIAIAALVAGLVLAYQHFDGFRKVVDIVGNAIKTGFLVYIDIIKTEIGLLYGIFKAIFNGIADIWNNTIGKAHITIPDIPGLPGRGQTFGVPNIPKLANGGIVTSPTMALIGEAGPEAVVPLNRANAMGNNVTINVNGGDPNAVVSALRTYMRQNGSIPIRVSNIY